MDLINEDDVMKKIVNPLLDRLEGHILPSAIEKLKSALREILDGATVTNTTTINLKPGASQ